MSSNVRRVPEDWRNYSDKTPLAAIVLRKGDLKKLYKIINDKQIAFRDRTMSFLAQQPSETVEDFNARKTRVYNTYVVSMTINRTNGDPCLATMSNS